MGTIRNIVCFIILSGCGGCITLPSVFGSWGQENLLRAQNGIRVYGHGYAVTGGRVYELTVHNDNPYPVFVRFRYSLAGVTGFDVAGKSGGLHGLIKEGFHTHPGTSNLDRFEKPVGAGPNSSVTRYLFWNGNPETSASVDQLESFEMVVNRPRPGDLITLTETDPGKGTFGQARQVLVEVYGFVEHEGRKFLRVRIRKENMVLGFLKNVEYGKALLLEPPANQAAYAWGPRNTLQTHEESCEKQDLFQSLLGPAKCGLGPLATTTSFYEVTKLASYPEY